MKYHLTKEMKNELLKKAALGNEDSCCPVDVEQIDWNLFLFEYANGVKQLKNLLRWDDYSMKRVVHSYQKIEYGLYLINYGRDAYLLDTRKKVSSFIFSVTSYKKVSEDLYLIELQNPGYWEGKKWMLYHLNWESVKGFPVFSTYRKLEGSFYVLDEGTPYMKFYNLDSNVMVPILEYTRLEEGLYLLKENLLYKYLFMEEYMFPEEEQYEDVDDDSEELLTSEDIAELYRLFSFKSDNPTEPFFEYQRKKNGRMFVLKKHYGDDLQDIILFDSKTGKESFQQISDLYDMEWKESEKGLVFFAKNGAFCEISFDSLQFRGWKFQ